MGSADSQPLNDRNHEADAVSTASERPPKLEDQVKSPSDLDVVNFETGQDPYDFKLPRARPFSVDSPAAETATAVGTSIDGSARPFSLKDSSVDDRPLISRQTSRSIARFAIMVLIATLSGIVVSSAWQSYGDEAKQIVRTWASSLNGLPSARGDETKRIINLWAASVDWLRKTFSGDADMVAARKGSSSAGQISARDGGLSQSTSSVQKPVPVAAEIPVEWVQQFKSISHDIALIRQRLDQLAVTQEQMTQKIASLQAADQDIRQKMSSLPVSSAAPRPPRKNASQVATPQQPAHLSILADWWITDSRNGYILVQGQGHGDRYEVVPGAPLPGLGPIEQIKRQDGRWMVVTRKGIIVSRRDRQYFETLGALKN